MTEQPLDWIREIESSIVALDQKPQFGLPTPLEWEKVEKEIQRILGKETLQLSHTVQGWTHSKELFEGLSGNVLALPIEYAPLKSPAFFVTDAQTLKNLMASTFESDEVGSYFVNAGYVEAFFSYFAAEMLHILSKQQFASPLTPRIGSTSSDLKKMVGDQSCFVIDTGITINSKNFWGKLILTEKFRKEWKEYFNHLPKPAFTDEMKQKISVDLSLEVAHSRLSLKDWESVKTGDFVVLDLCSYDPEEHKGAVVLTLNQKPVFRGRFKDGGIKITNYPVYEEASDAMEDRIYGQKNDSEDDDDDLFADLDAEHDSEFDEDDDLFKDEEPVRQPAKEKKIPTEMKETEEPLAISMEDLPIHLTVEVGRVKMTAGALMDLAPGNLLDLNVSPSQGVDLVVNGKKVGRGELIRMGDVLGVRVLTL